MKNLVVTFAMSLILLTGSTMFTHAQKFQSGDKNLEVQFSPLSNQPINIDGIRFRSFNSESSAFRLNLNVSYNSNSTVRQVQDVNNETLDLTTSENIFELDLRPGYEFHLEGTDRLSPYFGGELVLGFKSTSNVRESYNSNDDNIEETTVSNGQPQSSFQGNSGPSSRGFLNLGLNGVAGVDYYFADNIYLGAELSFGANYTSYSSISFETEADVDTPDDVDQGSNINISPGAQGAIRLGYVF